MILEPLKIQGVEQPGDFVVQIRAEMMTLPGEQFVIRRKAYAMIKKAFDENGIKFAFPTVQLAGEGDPSNAAIAQRALELMVQRATTRVAFGKPLAEQGVIQEWIAQSLLEIEQARLLTLKTAWMIDNLGKKAAQKEIAMIKIAVPQIHTNVVSRAMQVFGAAGLTDDFPLASMWAHGRTLHIADGPDEVHKRALARSVIRELTQ